MWKTLKLIWREIRPNATWDLIKYMLIAGISFLVLYGYRLLAYARELPQDTVVDVVIFAAAFILITCAMALTRYRDNQVLEKMLRPVLEQAERVVAATGTSKEVAPPQSERIFVKVTPEYLASHFYEHTGVQATKLVEPYVGKWINVFGIVNDVSNALSQTMVILNRPRKEGHLLIFAKFREQKWVDRIVLLRRKDKVAVVGQISSVSDNSITLDYCEMASDDTIT